MSGLPMAVISIIMLLIMLFRFGPVTGTRSAVLTGPVTGPIRNNLINEIFMYQLSGPRPMGPKEIDGLLVPPDKAYTLLTDHLITG